MSEAESGESIDDQFQKFLQERRIDLDSLDGTDAKKLFDPKKKRLQQILMARIGAYPFTAEQ